MNSLCSRCRTFHPVLTPGRGEVLRRPGREEQDARSRTRPARDLTCASPSPPPSLDLTQWISFLRRLNTFPLTSIISQLWGRSWKWFQGRSQGVGTTLPPRLWRSWAPSPSPVLGNSLPRLAPGLLSSQPAAEHLPSSLLRLPSSSKDSVIRAPPDGPSLSSQDPCLSLQSL